jgi:hypothetical protein
MELLSKRDVESVCSGHVVAVPPGCVQQGMDGCSVKAPTPKLAHGLSAFGFIKNTGYHGLAPDDSQNFGVEVLRAPRRRRQREEAGEVRCPSECR